MVETPKSNSKKRNRRRRRAKPIKNSREVTAPVSKTYKFRNAAPNFKEGRNHVTVTHKEYIQDITSNSVGFVLNSLSINPGVGGVFPWLSSIASRFESYIFDDLHFIYEPSTSTATPGSVMMAVDFDAGDTLPANKTILMANQSSTRTAVWSKQMYTATKGNLHKFGIQRYVRTAGLSNNLDVKTYDVGSFLLATSGTPASATTLGELYVQYRVRLFTPQIQTSNAFTQQKSVVQVMNFTVSSTVSTADSIVTGPEFAPIAWLHTKSTSPAYQYMAINLTNSGPLLMHIEGTSVLDKSYVMRQCDNTKVSDPTGLPNQIYPWFMTVPNGFTNTDTSNTVNRTFVLRPTVWGGATNPPSTGIDAASNYLLLGWSFNATPSTYRISWMPLSSFEFANNTNYEIPFTGTSPNLGNIVLPLLDVQGRRRWRSDEVNGVVHTWTFDKPSDHL